MIVDVNESATSLGHVWGAVGPNAEELWNRCVNCRADEYSVAGRIPCPARGGDK